MAKNTYNPENLVYNYRKLGHGKERADAIRYAISQADLNNDIPYMIYFREEFCYEAGEYTDKLDIITVFPELLSLTCRYPDAKLTPFQADLNESITDEVLWAYSVLLETCDEFYQIPFNDCIKFYNDYRERYTACGYNAKEPYRTTFEFYCMAGDKANASKFFTKFKNCSQEPYGCQGCDVNSEIVYYLFNNEKGKADSLAKKIEDGILSCKDDDLFLLLRLKVTYLKYYICQGDYEKAAECAYILEHAKSQKKEFNTWAFIMCAYVYSNPGRGLRIYKKHWAEWENERNPMDKFGAFKCAACFFMGLKKSKNTDMVKIKAGKTFPLYNEENIYKLDSLIKYYYKEAEEIAGKFDKRNGTDKFKKELVTSFKNILSYKT